MSSDASFPDVLHRQGFEPIGCLDYRLHLSVWWSAQARIQVLLLRVGEHGLVKGDKSYYLRSAVPEGETWARDLGLLHDYLENHFPELRIAFSHFRDVPPTLADAEARRRLGADAQARPIPTVEHIARLQRELDAKRHGIAAGNALMGMSAMAPDLLSGYVRQRNGEAHRAADALQADLEGRQRRLDLFQHLQREYMRKGSAAVYTFSVSSHLHASDTPSQFGDALRAVVKELTDQHRYHVTQKLQGGKLNIHVAEAEQPAVTWIEQWLGGAISPAQLARLGGPVAELLQRHGRNRTMVTPDEPIVVDGRVRQAEKHVAARLVSDVLSRLDKTESVGGRKAGLNPDEIPGDAMPLRVGLATDEAGRVKDPAVLPLAQVVHACVSGTTGSGKSFLARVLVEEAALHESLNVLVLDPRNQFAGLLVPEHRRDVLARYAEFGMDVGQARGFAFGYFAPALPFVPPLPDDLAALGQGRSIVSFKGMDDRQRCDLAARVLDAVFAFAARNESDRPRLLIAVDEAQLLTRKRVDESAKDAATRVERALDRIAREGRKYGIVLLLVSQSIKDFSHDLAALRQMATTKIFLRNSDREVDYAADVVGDGRALVHLPTGTALVHNANWGLLRVRVRPPYSKVSELPEADLRHVLAQRDGGTQSLTADAARLLGVIKDVGPAPDPPLNMSRAGALAGITSKRRLLELVAELETAGVIYTRTLPERGRPRVIELVGASATRW